LLAFCFTLVLPVCAAEPKAVSQAAQTPAPEAAAEAAPGSFHLRPGTEDGKLAFAIAALLNLHHYVILTNQLEISSEFLDDYLNALDPQHLDFLQSDLAGFEGYRTNLEKLTLTRKGVANVTPAYAIFSRFVERLEQRVSYVDELLKHERFEFTADERIPINRRDAPFPEDLNEAKQLWRQRLRYDYLQEKLSREESAQTSPAATNAAAKTEPAKSLHEQIVETLTRRYHRNLRLFTDWNNEDVMGVYLTALTHVYDPHSDYLNHEQMVNFGIAMNLELSGIGAQLGSDDGYCKVQMLVAGGPAAKSHKIKEGDRIVAVAQGTNAPVDVVDMNLTKVVQMIRGRKGTEVRLTIVPAADSSTRKVVTLIRDEIQLEDQAAKAKIIDLPNGHGGNLRLGIIDLPSFYAPMPLGGPDSVEATNAPRTSVDVARLLTYLKEQNVNGVILDLRRNGGGVLEEAIRLTGLFIKEGPVVQVRVRKLQGGQVFVEGDDDPAELYDGPLIVLTDHFSASASEIVAGALQDYGRALIVGESSTHGKGTVQSLNSLTNFIESTNDLGDLKLTIRKFYRPSGVSTQLKGVLPDIVLPSLFNYSDDIGERSLDHPLTCDAIPSTRFDKLDFVQPYLAELLKRSAERIATDQDFTYVREDIEQYRKLQADKTVSLNEQQRLKELAENKARQQARDRERLARKEPDEKIYDISLKQAALPGLPAPEERTNSSVAKSVPNHGIGAGTNSTLAAVSDPAETAGADDPSDAEKPPAVDPELDEAERIMMDYISLLPKSSPLLFTQTGQDRLAKTPGPSPAPAPQ